LLRSQSVFQLPTSNRGKLRSIDLLLEDLKKCAELPIDSRSLAPASCAVL
jgi:hypothetical protein